MRTHNDNNQDGTFIDADGTHLMGYVNASYKFLVRVFGEPLSDSSGDGKVKAEWIVEFDDGTVGTIYDYKSSKTPQQNTHWHVGGHSKKVVTMIQSKLNQ